MADHIGVAVQKICTEFYQCVEDRLKIALAKGKDLAVSRSFELKEDRITWYVEYLEPGTDPEPGREWTVYRLQDIQKCHLELSSR